MPSREDVYHQRLNQLLGDEATVYPFDVDEPPPISLAVFWDRPTPGSLTAFTYGLSLAEHPAWNGGGVELCISVRSTDFAWANAAGMLAATWRGVCPFHDGDLIDFGRPRDDGSGLLDFGLPMAEESSMSAFVVFAPRVLGARDSTVATPGGEIRVQGVYPLYAGEKTLIQRRGLDAFLERPGLDLADVKRRDQAQRARR